MKQQTTTCTVTKKVTVFVGSARRHGATSRAASQFVKNLESYGDVRGEIVFLSDYDLGVCNGCKRCTNQGEERCPLKDDRDVLIGKMVASDGVAFASPNYSFQVSAIMKMFLDRLAFVLHRPRFHGKTFTSIVVQAIGMGGRIVKYLEFVGGGLGFNVVKGSCSRTLEPMSQEAQDRMERNLARQSRRFHDRLLRPAFPTPSFLGLMMFRMARTGYRQALGEDMRDNVYFRDRGWFESDYYYPVRLGPFKKAAGVLFDRAAARMFRPRETRPVAMSTAPERG